MDELRDLLNEDLIVVDLDVNSKDEMIDELVSKFESEGFVKDSYKEALKKREQVFPTGLDTGEVKVCVPHTDAEHVNKAGILVATLKNPISYQRMDDPSSEIDVDLVFMLAVKDPSKQVGTLGKLMSLFCKSEVLQKIKSLKDKNVIYNEILNNAQ